MPDSDASGTSGTGGGNTITPSLEKKKRIGDSKKWCFTLNNPVRLQVEYLKSGTLRSMCKRLVWQWEKGESGNIHIQGALEFWKRQRPMGACKELHGAHWEKMRAKGDEAYVYASKEETREDTGVIHGWKPKKQVQTIQELYPWQEEVRHICMSEADDRTIMWIWESEGNTGKSSFTKYMCVHYGALVVSGKTADIHNGILKWKEDTGEWPDIVIVDVPRENLEYINYGAIEKVKDGCFYSGKYEGGMVLMNSPHVIFFANEPPRLCAMSADRWDVRMIQSKVMVRQ